MNTIKRNLLEDEKRIELLSSILLGVLPLSQIIVSEAGSVLIQLPHSEVELKSLIIVLVLTYRAWVAKNISFYVLPLLPSC